MAHRIRPVKIESPRLYSYDGTLQYDGAITYDNIHLVYTAKIRYKQFIRPTTIASQANVYNVKITRSHPVETIYSAAQVYSPKIFHGWRIQPTVIASVSTVYTPSLSLNLLPILIDQYYGDLYTKLGDMKDDAYASVGEGTMEPYFKDLFNAIVDYIRSPDHDALVINVVQTIYSYFTMSYVYNTDDSLMNSASVIQVFNMGGVVQDILNHPVDYYSQSDGTNITTDTNAILDSISSDITDIQNDLLDPMTTTISNKIDEVMNPSIETSQLELLDKQRNYDKVMVELGYESYLNTREQTFSEIDFLF